MKIKILLADDHKLFRDGLRTMLGEQKNIEVVGDAVDGMMALELAGKLKPDIILMDISMPGLNGIEATRRIGAEYPDIFVIILSMHSERRFVVESLKAGARGYFLKDSAIEELIRAIETVKCGQVFLSSQITDFVVKDYMRLSDTKEVSAYSLLSGREREVLQLLAEGKSTREIAEKLFVSVKTVETHRKQIMNKLDIRSIAELTKYAIREGLTDLE